MRGTLHALDIANIECHNKEIYARVNAGKR